MKNDNEKLIMGGIRVGLPDSGYRHAIDPFLLCAFSSIGRQEKVVDLGTAAGIVPLVLSAMNKGGEYVGVEIQAGLVRQARENIALNSLQDRVEIIDADIRDIGAQKILPQESCDVVVSNPPYRKVATGKIAPDDVRGACRHELNGDINDFIAAAFYLLRNKGRFAVVYLPERLPELLSAMRQKRIEPKRMRLVHSRFGSDAVIVLVEGRKNGGPGMTVEAPLCIYDGDEYSREVREIFALE